MAISKIGNLIHIVRGQQIMLDTDLASLYGVETKQFNRAVVRNRGRFPDDFMFHLSLEETRALRFQFGASKKGRGGRRYLPLAFTEQGVAMLSSVLRSERAVNFPTWPLPFLVERRDSAVIRGEALSGLKFRIERRAYRQAGRSLGLVSFEGSGVTPCMA
jgi:hypothetical protein